MRSVPDVAINADPRVGIGLCQADAGGCPTGLSYGGTSMAAPEMTALTADLNQRWREMSDHVLDMQARVLAELRRRLTESAR